MCRSVGQGESLPDMSWFFEFVDDGHGEVLDRNAAGLVSVHQHLVATQAEASGALT